MNNRIKELAKQCNFTDQDIADMNPGFEKFAELIIGECTETVRQVLREEGSTLSYNNAAKIQASIKEYFGVE
jgi:uncharacterized protein with HEPN domain